MCKAALERFTTGLASEVYGDNIAVNVVSPGLVATPGVAVHGLINEQTKDRVQQMRIHRRSRLHRLASGDPKTLTGRIDHAAPFLKEMNLEPSALVLQAGDEVPGATATGEPGQFWPRCAAASAEVVDLESRLGVTSIMS